MIDEINEGGHLQEIPFQKSGDAPKYRCYGEIIQLDWTPPTFGNLVIPEKSQAKMGLPFFKIKVIAAGPDCKLVKVGDHVLMPQQVILKAQWDGGLAYFSSESKILGIVE